MFILRQGCDRVQGVRMRVEKGRVVSAEDVYVRSFSQELGVGLWWKNEDERASCHLS